MFVRVFAPFLDLSNLRIEPSLSPTEGEIVTLWPFQSRKPAQSQRGQVNCTAHCSEHWNSAGDHSKLVKCEIGGVWAEFDGGDIYLHIREGQIAF